MRRLNFVFLPMVLAAFACQSSADNSENKTSDEPPLGVSATLNGEAWRAVTQTEGGETPSVKATHYTRDTCRYVLIESAYTAWQEGVNIGSEQLIIALPEPSVGHWKSGETDQPLWLVHHEFTAGLPVFHDSRSAGASLELHVDSVSDNQIGGRFEGVLKPRLESATTSIALENGLFNVRYETNADACPEERRSETPPT